MKYYLLLGLLLVVSLPCFAELQCDQVTGVDVVNGQQWGQSTVNVTFKKKPSLYFEGIPTGFDKYNQPERVKWATQCLGVISLAQQAFADPSKPEFCFEAKNSENHCVDATAYLKKNK